MIEITKIKITMILIDKITRIMLIFIILLTPKNYFIFYFCIPRIQIFTFIKNCILIHMQLWTYVYKKYIYKKNST